MSVECTGRNVEVTAAVRDLAKQRTQKLERHLGGPATVRVVLSHEKHRFGAEIIATHRRRRWKAQEEMADPRAALALAFEKIDAQAKKDVARRRNHKSRAMTVAVPALSEESESAAAAAGGPPAEPRIVRSAQQRLPVKPMSTEEAAMRLENSRQEFLVFRDSGSERISVLYKRRDGDFGLIVPEC